MVAGAVVVLGGGGQLGAEVARALGARAVVPPRSAADVTEPASLGPAIPAGTAWVVNLAAFHDVERCEVEPERAFAVNAAGAWHAARAAAAAGAGIVFVSTDYVFDGAAAAPYDESAPVAPVNVYGASKAAGETLTRLGNSRHLVVRTSYLYGPRPSGKGWNLVSAILAEARAGRALRVGDGLVLSPTSCRHLATKLVEVMDAGLTGLVHLANAGACTREEFTRHVLAAAGLSAEVVRVGIAELPWRARRPVRSALTSAVLGRAGLAGLPAWQDGVRDYLAVSSATSQAERSR